MKRTRNELTFRKSCNWFVCLMLTLTVLQSEVIAPPIANSEATTFLQRFGYMREQSSNSSVISMMSIKNAILDYQQYMGLNETGELDNVTLTMMSKPRCGVKDKLDEDDEDLVRRKRYVMEGSKWASKRISYRITKYPKRIKDRRMVNREFRRAFEAWRFQTPLRLFVEGRGSVDIKISFEKRNHGDGNSFDGPGWTLAHATPPKRNAFIHFDDEEKWTIDEHSGMNLFQVAVHEIGHSLGLLHSKRRNSIMFPNYNETAGPLATLSDDDISGIRELYGDLRQPNMCSKRPNSYRTIDAATMTEDGKAYMFHGKHYWEFVRGEGSIARPADGIPRNISDDWVGLLSEVALKTESRPPNEKLLGPLDAALTWTNGQTFFFRGYKYWSFRNKIMDSGYPKLISEGFKGIPMNIDAAIMWNNQTYFFKGSNFWVYDREKTPPVDPKYPQPISNLEGVPDDINAAMQFADQSTYLFKGHRSYKLNNETFTVDPTKSSEIPKEWFACE